MDTTNGHNEKLVEYINYLYNKNSESFRPILQALFVRDMEEANDKGINLSLMYKDYNGFAYEMLQHVCDDLDLSVIIDFIRHKEIDDNGNTKYLNSNGWN